MKNLPDEELFDKLKVRLQNFEEDPGDDVWSSVDAELRPKTAAHSRARYSLILILMILGLGRGYWMQVNQPDRAALNTSAPSNSSYAPAISDSTAPTVVPSSVAPFSGKSEGGPAGLSSAVNSIDSNYTDNNNDAVAVRDGSSSNGLHKTTTSKAGNEIPPSQLLHGATTSVAANELSSSSRDSASDRSRTNNNLTGGWVSVRDNDSNNSTDAFSPGARSGQSNRRDQLSDSSITAEQLSATSIQPNSQHSDSSDNRAQPGNSALISVAAKPDSILPQEVIVKEKAQKRESRWRIYGMTTPSLTFHHVSPTTSDNAIFERLNSPGVLSSERLSFSFEGGVQFPIVKRLHAFAGLTYYQQSMDLSLEQIIPGTSISPNHSLDFNFQPNTTTTTINYRMQNIGVASGVSYVISVGKIIHQLGGALQYEYGLVKRSADENDQSSNSFVNFRIFYRAEYGLNERLSLFIQPVFSRSLMFDEVMNGAIKVKQSRPGIGFGILYHFK